MNLVVHRFSRRLDFRCASISCHGRRGDRRAEAWRRSRPRCLGSRCWTGQTRPERCAPRVLPLPALSVLGLSFYLTFLLFVVACTVSVGPPDAQVARPASAVQWSFGFGCG